MKGAMEQLPRALVVDDDERRRGEIALPLEAAGARVTFAATIAEAVVALSGPDRVDVVLAAVRAGDSAAANLLRAIRTIDRDVPVMFVTSWPRALEVCALCTDVVTAARQGLQRRRRPSSMAAYSPREGECR
jgi:CheY-like chemotaxis protein